MFLSRRVIPCASHLHGVLINTQKVLSFPILLKIKGSYCECRKNVQNSSWMLKDKIPSSVTSKYELFNEEGAPVILDVEEEREKTDQEEIKDKFEGINLQRGVTGVFDIEEIVELLKREKAENIFVVRIPPEANYADYMVIVTGRSKVHMLAVFEFIRKVYKKKRSPGDLLPNTEGKTSKDWMAIDLGNIIIHMFAKKARETYDLESLWSLGREYDSLSQEKAAPEKQILSNYENVLAKLIPNEIK